MLIHFWSHDIQFTIYLLFNSINSFLTNQRKAHKEDNETKLDELGKIRSLITFIVSVSYRL